MATSKPTPKSNNQEYTSEHIQYLGDIEGIRKNPGMYIGGTGSDGMHHLVNEILDNAVDEFGQGRGSKITVTLREDGSISVADDGAGIPVTDTKKEGVPAVQLVFTKLHAGGKFGGEDSAYKRSGGLHGIGATAVNALSEWLTCDVHRDGKIHRIRFSRGHVTEPLTVVSETKRTGTTVSFRPDRDLFGDTDEDGNLIPGSQDFKFKKMSVRMRDLAFLNPGLTIELVDERSEDEPKREVHHSELGLAGYIKMMTGEHDPTDMTASDTDFADEEAAAAAEEAEELGEEAAAEEDGAAKGKGKGKAKKGATQSKTHTPVIQLTGELDEVQISCAFQYTDHDRERIAAYTNNIFNKDGGTHVQGFQMGITNSVKKKSDELAELDAKSPAASKKKKGKSDKKSVEPRGDDFRYGLTGVIAVKVDRPEFSSQDKAKLVSKINGIVQRFVNEKLSDYLEENPDVTKKIRTIAEQAARIRDAMKKARDAVKSGKSLTDSKLTPCRLKDNTKTELFLVEGDSAGGTAKSARDAVFQALLPLRGKILNVEKAKIHKMLGHREINELIHHIGASIGEKQIEFDVANRKYDKIIIMTDADVDGAHIRTLLLTFLFRQMRPLIEAGHVYIALPPLFQFAYGKGKKAKSEYIYTERERDAKWLKFGLESATMRIRKPDAPKEVSAEELSEEQVTELPRNDLKQLSERMADLEARAKYLNRRNLTIERFLSACREEGGELKLPKYCVVESLTTRLLFDDAEREAYEAEHTEEVEVPVETADDEENGQEQKTEKRMVYTGPEIEEIDERWAKRTHEVLERLLAYGAKYGITKEMISVQNIQSLVVAGEPAPYAIVAGTGKVQPAYSLENALRVIRTFGRESITKVIRYKGLGEMDAPELRDTTMDPATRTLKKVTVEDALEAEDMFSVLMGTDVRARYHFIQKNAPQAQIDV